MKTTPRFPIRKAKVVSRIPEILRLCQGRKVLHLGCTDSPYTNMRGEDLLHFQLGKVTGEDQLWGLDSSEDGVEFLKHRGVKNLILGDVESALPELRNLEFDIILAGEIIEHVGNPGRFLAGLTELMNDSSELILTTVNGTSLKGFIHALFRREKVHPDHNYYFSYRTVQQLLSKFGLHCDEVYYYQEVQGAGLTLMMEKLVAWMLLVTPVWSDGVFVRASLSRGRESKGREEPGSS